MITHLTRLSLTSSGTRVTASAGATWTTERHSLGNPASYSSSAQRFCVYGTCSEDLRTTVLPARRGVTIAREVKRWASW